MQGKRLHAVMQTDAFLKAPAASPSPPSRPPAGCAAAGDASASISNQSPFSQLDPLAEGQRRGAEEVHVDLARPAEQGVFEMVSLEVGHRWDMLGSPERNGFSQIMDLPRRMRETPGRRAGDRRPEAPAPNPTGAAWNGRAKGSSPAR